MIAAVAAGFAIATWKTARIAHGVLARPMYSVALTGFVETRDIRERTDRFVLRVATMESARGTIKARARAAVGEEGHRARGRQLRRTEGAAAAAARAVAAGQLRFRPRHVFSAGIGASGFVMGAIKTAEPPARRRAVACAMPPFMQGLRDAIDARIRTTLEGDKRAIATALLTGRRDAISPPVNDAMFISGLGHVLSISGYHMAVVAGVVFFAVRALLALFPALTVGFAIKKWSAAAALVAAAFYLLLSGAEVATQRSFFMTAVVLIAVMVDRRAITFRTLAVAALIVLTVAPEALVHPSFQMSFAATLGLVALVQIGMPRLFATPDHTATARVALWGGREIAMLLLASLVAGLATTPYAAFHFHRVTPYGVLANLAAMPVVSAVVMPAGLLGLVAMPFGFDGVFWAIMGVGIDWMIAVAQWVAALPGAVGRMPAFGIGPLIAASLGIILLGLLRTPLRWSGAALVLVGGAVGGEGAAAGYSDLRRRPQCRRPRRGWAAASDACGKGSRDAFLLKEWLAADADARTAADASLTSGVSCDDIGCVMQIGRRRPGRAGAAARGAGGRLRARGADRDAAAGARVLRGLRDRCRPAAAAGRDGAAARP